MDKEDAILLSEFGKTLWAIRQRAIASGELVPKTHDELLRELDPEAYIVKLHEALAASEQRNRELTARLDEAIDIAQRIRDFAGEPMKRNWAEYRQACHDLLAISPTPAQPAAGEKR